MKDAGKYGSYSDGGLPNGPYQEPAPRTISPNDGEREALSDMEARKDAAYLERNQVVAALASAYPSGIARTAIEGWSEDWHGCVYVDLPTGQASWHYHDTHAYLFAHLPPYAGQWDGHTTEEKYKRLATLAAASPDGAGVPVAWRCGEWVFNTYEDAYECQSHDNTFSLVPLYAAPQAQPEPSDDARDAARYRWLTAHGYYAHADDIADIDRDIAATPQPEPSVQPPAEASEPKYSPPYIGPAHTERGGKVELWPHQYKEDLLRMHRMGWYDRAALATPQPPAPVVPLKEGGAI